MTGLVAPDDFLDQFRVDSSEKRQGALRVASSVSSPNNSHGVGINNFLVISTRKARL